MQLRLKICCRQQMQTATATHNLEMAIATATPTTIVAEVAEKL